MSTVRASRIHFVTIAAFGALVAALVFAVRSWQQAQPPARENFPVFLRGQAQCVIVVPDDATAAQREAARLIADTLAATAGRPAPAFPIRNTGAAGSAQRMIVVAPASLEAGSKARWQRAVGYEVRRNEIRLAADWPEDVVLAASWFLEHAVGARWFMPGPLGREVEERRSLMLPVGAHRSEPAYVSRNLSGMRSKEEKAWFRRNRFQALFRHGHSADAIITPEAIAANPALAPEVNGAPFFPRSGDTSWQPNLTSGATVDLATAALANEMRADPARLTTVFGQNDSWRWDQSVATLAAVAPHRHFRNFPDYSNTLFAFLNRVAERLAPEFPDRFVSTYSYQWTENVPRFRVHPMVLPYLTADRSQWFDPDFAAEDQDLMRRWTKAGPRFVGIYDYYYGAPFFIPRPTLYAVRQSIPFAHDAGVRGFYAEAQPNWGLDGPKLWLAAQLLWDVRQDPAALLDEYFARFWKEAAAPMRDYFEICERRYLEQPRPGYWLRYFKDDHQRLLFPAAVREEMRATLERAEAAARTPVVRERLAFFRRAFEVFGRFCAHDETREALTRLAFRGEDARAEELVRGIEALSHARAGFEQALAALKRDHPGAIAAEFIDDYSRHDPRSRAVLALVRGGNDLPPLDESFVARVWAGRRPAMVEMAGEAKEMLVDRELRTIVERKAHPFTLLNWNEPGGRWVGQSEPFATLRRGIVSRADGGNVLRYSGANQESLYQSQFCTPGALYVAQVRVKAKVSPGNMTYLFLAFADAEGRTLGLGTIDRLPAGDWSEGVTLQVAVRAPPDAAAVGIALRTLWQVDDDFAEWSEPSLRGINQ